MKTRVREKSQLGRKCPSCQSLNVRKSALRAPEARKGHTFLSPYRCRDCRDRFWVVSQNTYYLAGVICTAMLVAAVVWSVRGLLDQPLAAPVEAPPPASQQFVDMMKLAEANDPVAEYEVARRLTNGEGVPTNLADAAKWFERSAAHDHVEAQYELGLVLQEGRGTTQDYLRARTWLQAAAEGGHPEAQFMIGLTYWEGKMGPVDPVKAYIWFNVAAARGVAAAVEARDAAAARLTPDQVVKAQVEARRLLATFK